MRLRQTNVHPRLSHEFDSREGIMRITDDLNCLVIRILAFLLDLLPSIALINSNTLSGQMFRRLSVLQINLNKLDYRDILNFLFRGGRECYSFGYGGLQSYLTITNLKNVKKNQWSRDQRRDTASIQEAQRREVNAEETSSTRKTQAKAEQQIPRPTHRSH